MIDFTCDTDTWQDDATSPLRHCLTGAMQLKQEFLFTDGRCTRAASATPEDSASAQGSLPGPAKEISDATIARLRAVAQASHPKTPANTAEEEKKKEDGDKHMDADDAPVADKDKDAAGGPDMGGGSGMVAV